MNAYFDSPETIRNKVKEFKTATIGGVNKQDVMNYLSHISDQQGVLIKLLRECDIPLLVDDGYNQEEQFIKPVVEGQDNFNINQYLGVNNTNHQEIVEMQAEIEALKAENESLRMASLSATVTETTSENASETISDFDVQYGIGISDDEKNSLLQALAEKEAYIKELENSIQGSSDILINSDFISNNSDVSDVERQAYEEEIVSLRAELEEMKKSQFSSNDLFNTEVVSLDESMKESYEAEIESLKSQLKDALDSQRNIVIPEFSPELSTSSDEEIIELRNTIDTLNSTVSELQSELQVCHELLDEHATSDRVVNTNDLHKATSIPSNTDDVDYLKSTIEVLELEVNRKDREIANMELKLNETTSELSKFTNFTDDFGNVISFTPEQMAEKFNEVSKLKAEAEAERQQVEIKLAALSEKEAIIESNKHLVSEDFVNNLNKKEQEIDSLRKQMDRMLVVAQATADETEKEAKNTATRLLEDAKSQAESIFEEARLHKESLLKEANETLNSANEFKSRTEEELAKFREETRHNAEEIILEAQSKANEVIETAQAEAQKSQEEAIAEIEKITSQAEAKVAEIDAIIQSKQKELDNMQTYYLKVKNDGLVAVKKLYNQLENIIYSDELA